MEKTVEIEILKEIIDEFKFNNIKYWVTDGTALKLYRDNILFPSSDFDFAMFSEEIPKVLVVCENLKKNGYSVAYQNRLPFVEDFILIYPPKQCRFGPISFNFYHKNQNEAFSRNFNHPYRKEKFWIKFFALGFKLQDASSVNNITATYKMFSLIPKKIQLFFSKIIFIIYANFAKTYWYVIPLVFFNSLRKIEHSNLEFFIPKDIENFLEYRYGKTWRTPIKDWNKFECSHVRIRRLKSIKVKQYSVEPDCIEQDHCAPDVFAFSDQEINQILLRDKKE